MTERSEDTSETSDGQSESEENDTDVPDRRSLAAGSYLVMPVSGVAVSLLTDGTGYERFHALQSAFLGVGLVALLPVSVFAANIPFFFFAVRLYFVAAVVVWVVAMLTAYNGIEFEFPVAGPLARDYLDG